MSEPTKITRRITSVDGVDVVAVEKAHLPHPAFPDRTYQTDDILRVLLVDERVLFVCAGTTEEVCGYSAESATSVRSHRNTAHNPNGARGPQTPAETIKAVLRAVAIAKSTGTRAYAATAADDLNRRGVPSAHGQPWNAGSVSSLCRDYADDPRYRVRIPSAAKKAARAAAARPAGESKLGARLRALAAEILTLADEADAAPTVDPAVAEKAAKYDQMRGLFS